MASYTRAIQVKVKLLRNTFPFSRCSDVPSRIVITYPECTAQARAENFRLLQGVSQDDEDNVTLG